jgi:tetratricopeptide (TPR) repeat protein
MALTKLNAIMVLAACLALASSARAGVTPELGDLAGRIDYGFYVGDARAIKDAVAALKRMSDTDPDVRYYRAFASFRLAQLGGERAASDAESCVKNATVEEPTERLTRAAAEARARASVESWLLVAVCSGLTGKAEPGKGLAHDKRLQQALAHARELEPSNPRIALIDAWLLSFRPALADASVRDDAVKKLEAAADAFAAWSPPADAPDWGEAEALAALAELHLTRGDLRDARDLIERALLVAPDYRFAVELRAQLQGSRSAAAR